MRSGCGRSQRRPRAPPSDGRLDERLRRSRGLPIRDGQERLPNLDLERTCRHADILRRVEVSSALGGWSYEPVDTKLARERQAGTILQLCLYADLLAAMQGLPPEYMYVVAPWSEFQPQQYRFADYAAYFRKVKRAFLMAMAAPATDDTYPDPIEHCDICRWREACDRRRHDDDHLCLVAGISKIQIHELKARDIATVQGLAGMRLPLEWKRRPLFARRLRNAVTGFIPSWAIWFRSPSGVERRRRRVRRVGKTPARSACAAGPRRAGLRHVRSQGSSPILSGSLPTWCMSAPGPESGCAPDQNTTDALHVRR